jgi:hypothetical protein
MAWVCVHAYYFSRSVLKDYSYFSGLIDLSTKTYPRAIFVSGIKSSMTDGQSTPQDEFKEAGVSNDYERKEVGIACFHKTRCEVAHPSVWVEHNFWVFFCHFAVH